MARSKFTKRTLIPIGERGWHSEPKIIEGGRFSGRVLKGPQKIFTERQAQDIKKATELYQGVLKGLGIPIVPVQVKIVGHGTQRRVYFVQEHFPRDNILANAFQIASSKECLGIMRRLLSHVEKIEKYKTKGTHRLAMDINFCNWVLIDGEPHFLDFYPPSVKRKGSFDKREFSEINSRIVRLGHLVLYPRQQRKRYDPKRMLRALLFTAIQFRPELTQQFLQLGRQYAKAHYSGRGLKYLLKALEKPGNLVKPTPLGRIATSIEKKKREKNAKKRN